LCLFEEIGDERRQILGRRWRRHQTQPSAAGDVVEGDGYRASSLPS